MQKSVVKPKVVKPSKLKSKVTAKPIKKDPKMVAAGKQAWATRLKNLKNSVKKPIKKIAKK